MSYDPVFIMPDIKPLNVSQNSSSRIIFREDTTVLRYNNRVVENRQSFKILPKCKTVNIDRDL